MAKSNIDIFAKKAKYIIISMDSHCSNVTSFVTLLKVYDKCSGKGCANIGKTLLKIVYINKTGYFCESCSEDILHQELAEEVGAGII